MTDAAVRAGAERTDALLAIDPALAPPSALAPLMRRGEKPGFVVEDMTDVDAFGPNGVDLPDSPLYLIQAPDRGDEFENASPAEALEAITAGGRSPLLLTEGLLWVLQVPEILERNHCFMTIGSRIRKASGQLDSRTPALWISNGTGRDGRSGRTRRSSAGAGGTTATPGSASPRRADARPAERRERPVPRSLCVME